MHLLSDLMKGKYVAPQPHHNRRFTALFRDHPDEPVPEQNFWTLWCKGRLTEADTPTIRLGATPSGLLSDPAPSSPRIFTPVVLPVATLPIYPV